MQLVKVTEAHHWDAYHNIRQLVLYDLRGRDGYDPQHPDEYRDDRVPLLLLQNGVPVGTVRLDPVESERGIVHMVAILPSLQRQGIGRVMMLALEALALDNALGKLELYADPGAVGFYEKLGWSMTDAHRPSPLITRMIPSSQTS
nr:GNAT family N-acetyltransferase [Rhizobium sullae]